VSPTSLLADELMSAMAAVEDRRGHRPKFIIKANRADNFQAGLVPG
jgi:hypothetical protein